MDRVRFEKSRENNGGGLGHAEAGNNVRRSRKTGPGSSMSGADDRDLSPTQLSIERLDFIKAAVCHT